ncbi:MAG: hypothetical protein LBF84_02160 [Holosporales bacterium]|jgi:hypothetical protein|nr:hypothetical protein [Holosporales bacterium]
MIVKGLIVSGIASVIAGTMFLPPIEASEEIPAPAPTPVEGTVPKQCAPLRRESTVFFKHLLKTSHVPRKGPRKPQESFIEDLSKTEKYLIQYGTMTGGEKWFVDELLSYNFLRPHAKCSLVDHVRHRFSHSGYNKAG